MSLDPYRRVLALPGFTPLAAVGFLARIPATAAPIVLTLHVVLTLGHGYAEAGAVAAAGTAGRALAAPWLGRLVDRHGLRRMLTLTVGAEAVFWAFASWLPYPVLLPTVLVAGLLGLPVYNTLRQVLAAMVPPPRRRTAYAPDSMSVEVSHMIGPLVGTLLCVHVSTVAAMLGVGISIVAAGAALWVLNFPVRSDPSAAAGQSATPVRAWLTGPLIGVLLATAATTIVLYGAELAMIASLQLAGETTLIGVVIAIWSIASLVGGFVYGLGKKARSVFVLVAAMAVTSAPLGLAEHWWSLALALLPAGLLCAPSLAAASDVVARLAPERVRGLVMGLQGSALTVGATVGAPLAGAVTDASGPAAAFATVGALGAVLVAVLVAVAAVTARRQNPDPRPARIVEDGHTGAQ